MGEIRNDNIIICLFIAPKKMLFNTVLHYAKSWDLLQTTPSKTRFLMFGKNYLFDILT